MMTIGENEEFTLGEDVTSVAKSKSRGGTSVVAVRLSLEELSEIESISRETGKTVSQVLREAIKNGLHASMESRPSVTVSIGANSSTSGTLGPQGKATVLESDALNLSNSRSEVAA